MKKIILFGILCLFSIVNVEAYTKEDIINLIDKVKTCDSATTSAVRNLKKTYKKMLDEREFDEKLLNKLYNNVNKVINELKAKDVCKISDVGKLDAGDIKDIYSSYKKVNDTIVKAPVINEDGSTSSSNEALESVIKFDGTNNTIEITDTTGSINVAVKLDNKLNYVGINKAILFTLCGLGIVIVGALFSKRCPFRDGLIIVCIIIFIPVLCLRSYLSIGIDGVNSLLVSDSYSYKDAVVKDKKIISNPSYKARYAKILLDDDSEDVYYGDSKDLLVKGIGQDNNSELPGFGKVILSGHNTGFFKNLYKADSNSIFTIETNYGVFKYKYSVKEIVNDTDTSVLDKDYDLIMYTCYPNEAIYSGKRLVIMAKLVEDVWK